MGKSEETKKRKHGVGIYGRVSAGDQMKNGGLDRQMHGMRSWENKKHLEMTMKHEDW